MKKEKLKEFEFTQNSTTMNSQHHCVFELKSAM